MTKRNPFRLRVIFLLVILFLVSTRARADCVSPAAVAGAREYFTVDDTFRLCNGTDWVYFVSAGTLGACASEAALDYDNAASAYKFCDGTNWQKIGCVDAEQMGLVTTGQNHTCGIKSDGTAWCWGDGANGKLGNGSTLDQTSPVQVSGGGTWKAISAGGVHSCGIKSDGMAWCWGSGLSGKMGDGVTTSSTVTAPLQVSGGGTWKVITAGGSNSCGIKTDGTAWCWGLGTFGGIGDGNTNQDNLAPVQVAGGGTWKAISAGNNHNCGIKSDGTAWCWGYNDEGQIGNGTTTQQNSPVQVSGGGTWNAIIGGNKTTCGIKADGTGWCWGNGGNGQLGNGAFGDQLSPVQVSGVSSWLMIDPEATHTCGIKTDGTAWCWGGNANGKLGDGGSGGFSFNTPQQVSDAGPWMEAGTGTHHSCGLQSDGTAWCWGRDTNGQLGNGAPTADQLTPDQVSGTWGPPPGCKTLGACSSARAIDYFSAEGTLAFCNGSNWIVFAE